MNLFKRIGKAILDELQKPEPTIREEEFKQFVRDFLFPSGKYQLVHRSHSHHDNKEDFMSSSLLPDFGFRCEQTGKMFYVEVKFRKGTCFNDKTEWFKPYQLERYRKIDKENHPLFFVFGLEGNPQNPPEEVFIFPVSIINFTNFNDPFPDKYKFYVSKPILSNNLWNLKNEAKVQASQK